MSQRIYNRIFGDEGIARAERLRAAQQHGQYTDDFTTEMLTPEQRKARALASLERLPKCLNESSRQ